MAESSTNKTRSNEVANKWSNKSQCLKHKHSANTPVISRNGIETANICYQERVENPHSTSNNLNGTSIFNDFERTSSFKWWVR